MAHLLQTLKRFDEAEDLYRQSLTIRTNALGENHHEVILIKHNLSELLILKGKEEDASKMKNEILDSMKKRQEELGLGTPEESK